MADAARILVGTASPPIVLDPGRARRVRPLTPLPACGRLACALAGLALPALGIAVADTVHRVAEPRATQAAALAIPSAGVAAVLGHEVPRPPVFRAAVLGTAFGRVRR